MEHIQRSGRILAKNHSGMLPRYLIAFDAETLPTQQDIAGREFSHSFRLATATIGRMVGTRAMAVRRYRFTSPDEFWLWLRSVTASNYTTWLVSHNALFDLVVCRFMEKLEQGQLVIDWPRRKRPKAGTTETIRKGSAAIVIESPPTIIAARISDTQARLVCLDTLNWFPVSLKEMGDRCGLPKLDMPEFSAPDEDWFVYCQRDSDILFKSFTELIKWVKDNDFGVFRYTAPGQAMSAYRHRFMDHKLFVHDNSEVKKLERAAYFGGRTEVFRRGKFRGRMLQLDVNSLFPSVMRYGWFPNMLHRYELREDYLALQPDIEWGASVASVIIDTPEPIFPVRTRNCVIYPIGKFPTVLCGAELEYAHRKGYVKQVGSWSEYNLMPIFSKWVQSLYDMRLEYKRTGDHLYADFAKRLMNSLYGKFGEKAPKWQTANEHAGGLPWTTWTEWEAGNPDPVSYRMVGWECQRKVEGEETPKSFVAISAFVTSLARMRMNQLRAIASQPDVYYQGVDGLILTGAGYDRIHLAGECHDHALGKLRIIEMVDDGEIYGCSDYRMGGKVVIAGRAKKLETLEDGSVLQRKFHAANALFGGRSLVEVRESLQSWKRCTAINKGTIGDDGWIEPFALELSTGNGGESWR